MLELPFRSFMSMNLNDEKNSAHPLVAVHIIAQFRKLQAFLETNECRNSEKLGVVGTSSSATTRSSAGCAMLIHKHETGCRNTSNKPTNDTLMPRRPSYLSAKGSRQRLSSSYELPDKATEERVDSQDKREMHIDDPAQENSA